MDAICLYHGQARRLELCRRRHKVPREGVGSWVSGGATSHLAVRVLERARTYRRSLEWGLRRMEDPRSVCAHIPLHPSPHTGGSMVFFSPGGSHLRGEPLPPRAWKDRLGRVAPTFEQVLYYSSCLDLCAKVSVPATWVMHLLDVLWAFQACSV